MPSDPTLYLYTSLTAGSSHIITATSRIETILKANKLPFKAVDCATDDKARMLWQRRSKGRKLPGLVKFNDVIADLETVEDWNEHGELEDQIEDQIDIFGDVPISATSVEAHAAAAARLEAQKASSSSQGRTASETRHISISDPKSDARRQSEDNPAGSLGDGKRDTHSPLSMAMRQAGAEAAAKAGQSSSGSSTGTSGTSGKTATISTSREPSGTTVPAPTPAKVPKLDAGAEEVSQVETGAKTPEQLASQGQSRTSVDKLGGSPDGEDSKKSNVEQILDKRRQSSVVQTASSLSKTTSIDQSHTVTSSEDAENDKSAPSSNEHRGRSMGVSADKAAIEKVEKANAITEEAKDKDEADDGEEPVKKAAKVGASDKQEEKVLQGSKPQEQEAGNLEDAGKSVGD